MIEQDEMYMQASLREANCAYENGEVPTGCVIVASEEHDGEKRYRLVAKAHNQVEQLNDATAHAEMIAITQAASTLGDWRLTHCTLYVTKEPCAMCAGAIVLSRIPRIVCGVMDPKRGGMSVFSILNHEALIHRCELVSGILEHPCRELLQRFFRERRAGGGQ